MRSATAVKNRGVAMRFSLPQEQLQTRALERLRKCAWGSAAIHVVSIGLIVYLLVR